LLTPDPPDYLTLFNTRALTKEKITDIIAIKGYIKNSTGAISIN
jgi:hypothetical protein